MSGHQEKLDPGVFLERSVESACHYAYQVYLHFSGELDLRVEGEFEVSLPSGGGSAEFNASTCRTAPIGLLVGLSVADASVGTDGALCIRFGNGAVISCRPNRSFESYHVYIGKREYIV
jgi:hypothetical protein